MTTKTLAYNSVEDKDSSSECRTDKLANFMVDYGICCGTIVNKKIFTRPHFYKDGKKHAYGSDGVCEECLRINELIRTQRKISALEEKLNATKANIRSNSQGSVKQNY